MKFKYGNVFDTDLRHIGHGVNTVGVMGAGIAKQVKDNFPDTYELYKMDCAFGLMQPGVAIPGNEENGKVIWNIASQRLPGSDATLPWLAQALEFAIETMILSNSPERSMAIPQIGCGIGGLDWADVEKILIALESDYDFEFEVWFYGEPAIYDGDSDRLLDE